jgi:hypothetical protein
VKENNAVVLQVLESLSGPGVIHGRGKSHWAIGPYTIHARYRTKPKKDGFTFSFNINPNSLKSDFELWICADPQHYYLIPQQVVLEIYEHPEGYSDRHHPCIRVADIRTNDHRCTYARGGIAMSLSIYFRAALESPRHPN